MLERRIKQEIRDFLDGDRKEALMVTGARQVGKTYIIRECAKEIYKNIVEINFVENQQAVKLFANTTGSKDILLRLSKQRHGGIAPPIIAHSVKRYRMKGKLATVRKKKITGFHALYLRYLCLLRGGRRKKLPPKLPFSVKREVIHLERYEQQFKYLLSSGITTETELEQRIRVLEWDIRLLEEQRKPLYQERRNTSDEEAQAKYSAEIQQQTAALREKRGELRLCRRIQSDIPRVSQQCQQAQAERQENLKNKEEHEHEYQR